MRKNLFMTISLFLLSFLNGPLVAEHPAQIVIVRHGEGEHNLSLVLSSQTKEEGGMDHCLTAIGREQVAKTAQNLLDLGFNQETVGLVLVSPLLRTRQTAQILTDYGVCSQDVIQIDGRIREQIHQDWEGRCVTDIYALFPDVHDWASEVEGSARNGGETLESMKNRLESVLNELSQWDPSNGHVILVMHGFPSTLLLSLHGDAPVTQLRTAEAKIIPFPAFAKDR